MGLPSAQLGSLPSMNLPSALPTVQTQKSPKVWQQALLNILTQTAGNAAVQGVGNVMSQDFSETPATGWEKLTKGPRMDKSQKMQQTSLNAASTEAEKGRTFTAGENTASRNLTSAEAKLTRDQQAKLAGNSDELARDLARQQEAAAMVRLLTGGKMDMDKVFASGQVSRENTAAANALDQGNPKTQAQVDLLRAEVQATQQKVAQQAALQKLMAGEKGGAPGAPGTTPRTPSVSGQPRIGDNSGMFPQISDGLASLFLALSAGENPQAGAVHPYAAMRLNQQPGQTGAK